MTALTQLWYKNTVNSEIECIHTSNSSCQGHFSSFNYYFRHTCTTWTTYVRSCSKQLFVSFYYFMLRSQRLVSCFVRLCSLSTLTFHMKFLNDFAKVTDMTSLQIRASSRDVISVDRNSFLTCCQKIGCILREPTKITNPLRLLLKHVLFGKHFSPWWLFLLRCLRHCFCNGGHLNELSLNTSVNFGCIGVGSSKNEQTSE